MSFKCYTISLFAVCLFSSSLGWGQRSLSGLTGLACNIDLEAKTCTFWTTTEINADTGARTWQYPIFWQDNTLFNKITQLTSLAEVTPGDVVQIDMAGDQAELARQGKQFKALRLTVLPAGTKASGWASNAKNRLIASMTSITARTADIKFNDSLLSMLAPSRGMQRIEHCSDADLIDSVIRVRIFGAGADDKFLCNRIDLFPQPDPRLTDDPKLPRVLVIGDSISMNYHEAAKAALVGKANYHRISGNAAHTRNGLLNFEMWLGNTAAKGLHWDLVIINHGLHDLRIMDDGQHQIKLDQYRDNLRQLFQLALNQGCKVVWCTTTPVPNTSTTGSRRQKDDDLIYNQAAAEVLQAFPGIVICDLNALVRGSELFDQWRQGTNVHFRDAERIALGNKVAATIMTTLTE